MYLNPDCILVVESFPFIFFLCDHVGTKQSKVIKGRSKTSTGARQPAPYKTKERGGKSSTLKQASPNIMRSEAMQVDTHPAKPAETEPTIVNTPKENRADEVTTTHDTEVYAPVYSPISPAPMHVVRETPPASPDATPKPVPFLDENLLRSAKTWALYIPPKAEKAGKTCILHVIFPDCSRAPVMYILDRDVLLQQPNIARLHHVHHGLGKNVDMSTFMQITPKHPQCKPTEQDRQHTKSWLEFIDETVGHGIHSSQDCVVSVQEQRTLMQAAVTNPEFFQLLTPPSPPAGSQTVINTTTYKVLPNSAASAAPAAGADSAAIAKIDQDAMCEENQQTAADDQRTEKAPSATRTERQNSMDLPPPQPSSPAITDEGYSSENADNNLCIVE